MFADVATLIFIYMTTVFFIAQYLKDNSIVDIAWGLGFVMIALFTLLTTKTFLPIQLLLTTLIIIWGLRLSAHIYLRNKGKGEDPRYKNWRKQWGKNVVIRSFFQIFMLQGVVMFLVAVPIVIVNTTTRGDISLLGLFGLLVWCIGFFFEAVGDYQLYRFLQKKTNKGKVLKDGVWRYTRHPNYFGEVVMWWGIFLIALSMTPLGLQAIISPIIITFLLLYVSGIPMTEALFATSRSYAKYKKETSMFFPLPPKKAQ